MLSFLLWYLLITFLGLAVFPLVYWLLPGLHERGYAFARTAGLLIWAYLYWLLGSLGFLGNNAGGLVFSLALVVLLSALVLRKIGFAELVAWFRVNISVVWVVEGLFLVSFAAWAFVRAANPEIIATEKPMELAFINSILRSPSFPPLDPWLSGYAISYYYFGYVMVGMLAMFTGTVGSVAFNLGLALVFALGAVGAYGVVYNLVVRLYGQERDAAPTHTVFSALLGPVFVLLLSNAGGFLERLHARGVFWQAGPNGQLVSPFWSWLNIENLVDPPASPETGVIERFWWWWRSSRVVEDFSFTGSPQEVIDEFPFFSFLLGDLHPHVLAIPFTLLAVALAIHLFYGQPLNPIRLGDREYPLDWPTFGFAALALGGLAFLNTWDFPIYVALFSGVFVLRQLYLHGFSWERAGEFLGLGLALGISGALLYLPFYVGFASQAGGILPNIINPTRGAHLWVMFGVLFVPLFGFLAFALRREGGDFKNGLFLALTFTVAVWVFSLALGRFILMLPAGSGVLSGMGAPDAQAVFVLGLQRRLQGIGGLITLVALIGLALSYFFKSIPVKREHPSSGLPVVMLLVMLGALLVFAPEFVYLRDLFGTRMNTVFKFYYQAWLLWALAGAAGSIWLLGRLPRVARAAFLVVFSAVLVVGLSYPALALPDKTNGFNPPGGLTLDGADHASYLSRDDHAAVDFLQQAPMGTLVEAVGGSYTSGGRISVHTGLPALLGWPFHQQQWRGSVEPMGNRESDIQALYQSTTWDPVSRIIQTYDIRYIYIGPLERSTYRVNETLLRQNLLVLFEQGEVVVFKVP